MMVQAYEILSRQMHFSTVTSLTQQCESECLTDEHTEAQRGKLVNAEPHRPGRKPPADVPNGNDSGREGRKGCWGSWQELAPPAPSGTPAWDLPRNLPCPALFHFPHEAWEGGAGGRWVELPEFKFPG